MSSLFWSPSLAESLAFYNRTSLANCTVGRDFWKLFLLFYFMSRMKRSCFFFLKSSWSPDSNFHFFILPCINYLKKEIKLYLFRSFDSVSFQSSFFPAYWFLYAVSTPDQKFRSLSVFRGGPKIGAILFLSAVTQGKIGIRDKSKVWCQKRLSPGTLRTLKCSED